MLLFETKLQDIAKQLNAFQRSFEYIQDYIKVYGLRMWQEEFGRIINYSVQQEANKYQCIHLSMLSPFFF